MNFSPEQLTLATKHSNRTQRAFTIWELVIVLAILSVLAVTFGLALRPARARTKKVNCVNHLKEIGLGFVQWAPDHSDEFPMQISVTSGGTIGARFAYQHFQVLSNELNSPNVLICTAERNRTNGPGFGQGFGNFNVSYFVNLDASFTNSGSVLAGDRNLTADGIPTGPGSLTVSRNHVLGWTSSLHSNQGNILFSDGSVQGFNASQLNRAFGDSGVATNRLLIP